MQKLRLVGIAVLILMAGRVIGQEGFNDNAKRYIDKYATLAMVEQKKNGIPAAITLGQGILETEAGTSELMTEANNHFGIKCKNGWTGETFEHDDDAPNECFKKYKCAEESYRDHSEHLKRNPRYSRLFKLKETDYASWAVCLKKCGYATNPQYAQRLIKIIEDFNLQQYTYTAFDSSVTGNYGGNISPEAHAETVKKQSEETGSEPPAILKPAAHQDDSVKPVASRQHIVKAGETVVSIAKAEKVDVKKLMALNLLNPNEEPVPGSVLELQTTAKQKPVVTVTAMMAHSGNAITTDEQKGDYVTIDRSKHKPATEPARPQPAAAHTVAATPQPASTVPPKRIIIINDSKRPVRPPDPPTEQELADAAKQKEFDDLKAELDKVVYADDSRLIQENGSAAPAEKKTTEPAAKISRYYTVKRGDTAFSIARKNNITVAELKKWNDLPGGDVKAGQNLKVKE